jgi:hypothetical protein
MLYVGDNEAYELACKNLRGQWQQSSDTAFITLATRSLALKPRSIEEAKRLAERMDKELDSKPKVAMSDLPLDMPAALRDQLPDHIRSANIGTVVEQFSKIFGVPYEIMLYSSGVSHLRSGNPKKAIERLTLNASQSDSMQLKRFEMAGSPVIAIAYLELGDQEQAMKSLEQSDELFQQWTDILNIVSKDRMPVPWFDMIEFLLYYQEAHLRIRGTPAPTDRILLEQEQIAMKKLR